MSMDKFFVLVPVWGQEYIEIFLEYSLLTQVTPGNLGAIQYREQIQYFIFTRPQDAAIIEQSSAFKLLQTLVSAEVIPAVDINFNNPNFYEPFSECYKAGIQRARKDKAICIFLTADQMWAEGAFSSVFHLAKKGYRAVMLAGPRVEAESFLPSLQMRLKQSSTPWISLPPRETVQMAMDHLHPWDRSLFWDENNLGRPASFLFWSAGTEGFLMRCFHLHPILVNPVCGYPDFTGTIDAGDFVQESCPDFNQVYVVNDSDHVMYFSIAPARQSSELIHRPKTGIAALIQMAKACAMSSYNYRYLQKKIRFHTGDLSEAWNRVESLSGAVVDPVLYALHHPFTIRYYRIKKWILHTVGPYLQPMVIQLRKLWKR